jgi:hypothetical protein
MPQILEKKKKLSGVKMNVSNESAVSGAIATQSMCQTPANKTNSMALSPRANYTD